MLSARLNEILKFIDLEDKVADIGTDHGYLLDACINKGLTFCQGVENKKGPYDRALLTLKLHIDKNKVILTLADGLSELDDRIDTIVIAGMGGELISQILASNLDKAKKMKKIILEPNIKIYELRDYLSNNSFEIIDESIVEENNKFYEILVIRYNPFSHQLNEKEKFFGPILMKTKKQEFYNKWNNRLNTINNIFRNNNQIIDGLLHQQNLIKEVLND